MINKYILPLINKEIIESSFLGHDNFDLLRADKEVKKILVWRSSDKYTLQLLNELLEDFVNEINKIEGKIIYVSPDWGVLEDDGAFLINVDGKITIGAVMYYRVKE